MAWQRNAARWWQDRHERERGEENELAELEQRRETLDDAELWELARLTDARRGADAAEPHLRELLRRIPRHAAAAYTLGYNLLDRGDPEGVGLIETAIDRDPAATAPGSRVIASFLHRQGKAEEAERYEARAAKAEAAQAEAQHERESVYKQDSFLPHALEPADLSALTTELAKHRRVKRAWLARKDLKHNPESPVFVLGIDKGFDWRAYLRSNGFSVAKAAPDPLVDELASTLPFPGEAFVVPLHAENAWLKRKLKKVAGAKVV